MPLDKRVFLAEEFNSEKWLQNVRRNSKYTLETIRDELDQYVEELNSTLVSMIEDDYSAFLKLSGMLVNIDSMVAVLREPLSGINEKVEKLKNVLKGPLEEQRKLKEELNAAQLKRNLLELNLSAWDSLRKVEAEVDRLGSKEGTEPKKISDVSDTSYDEDLVTMDLERASQRLAEVMFLTSQSEHHDMPLLRQIAARTRGLEKSLMAQLENALSGLLSFEESNGRNNQLKNTLNRKALTRILRSYVAINRVDTANEVFRRVLILPFLDRSFTVGKLDGGVRGSCKGLGGIYADVLNYVVEECGPILQVMRAENEGLSEQYDLVGDGIAFAVHELLINRLHDVFSSGVADTLHYSYTATSAFFKILAKLSWRPEKTLRIGELTLGRWNLPVYLELRTMEVMTSLEDELSKSILDTIQKNKDTPNPYYLEATRVLWQNVLKCRDRNSVFLEPVAPGLFRLSLQVLCCFVDWAAKASTKDVAVKAWDQVPPKMLVYLAKDCNILAQELEENEVKELTKYLYGSQISSLESGVSDHVTKALDYIAHQLRSASSSCFDTIRISLGNECIEGVPQHLKSTVGIYRLSNHKAPTTASGFVASILKPFADFAKEHPDEASAMGADVVTHVVTEYGNQAIKICEEVKNTEAALKRFRKNKNKDKESSVPSTAECLRMQFLLDIQELKRSATEVKVDVAQVVQFNQLEEQFQESN